MKILLNDPHRNDINFKNSTPWEYRANLTNTQNSTGWHILEVQTKEAAPDHLQAMAAGLAEGYLTRISIIELYKQHYKAYRYCSDKFCYWLKDTFEKNRAFIEDKIEELSESDSYWHQVNLFYTQMEGMKRGYKLR